MRMLNSVAAVRQFIEQAGKGEVAQLVAQRLDELICDATSMEELVVFVILEAGEGIDQLQNQMGFQIMTDQGCPLWEVIEQHANCYELVFVLSQAGQGILVFAPKHECAPDILALCQQHAERRPPLITPDAPVAADPTDTAHRGGFFTPI